MTMRCQFIAGGGRKKTCLKRTRAYGLETRIVGKIVSVVSLECGARDCRKIASESMWGGDGPRTA